MSAQLALDGIHTEIQPALVMTAHYGRNADLIAAVSRLYVADGATVLDVTYGRGQFWPRTDTSRFTLIGSDLLPGPGAALAADFRRLPYRSGSADVIALDPPYVHSTTQPRQIERAYRNNESTPGMTQREILDLYRAGMAEAYRVLRRGGTLWLKCQDAVEGRQQQWNAITLYLIGLELGFVGQDLFILTTGTPPGRRTAARQHHARRNHSYLWILRK